MLFQEDILKNVGNQVDVWKPLATNNHCLPCFSYYGSHWGPAIVRLL